ncbi:hypothetical protein P3G55_17460 [Leptospira sp. 96542]|nr:hypothetical protein [Leptospira sp. 96542]
MQQVVNRENGLWFYETKHRITYNTKKPVPIRDIIQSLQGLEAMLGTVPVIISKLTEVEIDHATFSLAALESGSLIEDVVVRFFFKDKAGMEAFIDKVRDNKVTKGVVIAAVIGGVIGYGAHLATSQPAQPPAPSITIANNTIIAVGADAMQMAPETFAAAVREAVQANKKEVAQGAIKMMAPSRGDPESSLSIGTETAPNQVTLPPKAIAETPTRLDLGKNERTEDFSKVEIQLRAHDLDSKKTGWAGMIAGKTERLRIELDPHVNEADLFGKASVKADVTLVYEPRGQGMKLTPVKLFVRKIY